MRSPEKLQTALTLTGFVNSTVRFVVFIHEVFVDDLRKFQQKRIACFVIVKLFEVVFFLKHVTVFCYLWCNSILLSDHECRSTW